MAHRHRNYITLNGVLIWTNLKLNAHYVIDLHLSTISQPLDIIWMGVRQIFQIQFLTKLFTSQIAATATINYHFARLAITKIGRASCRERVYVLV